MSDYPNRMNKSMMNSPYYTSYKKGGGASKPRNPSGFVMGAPGATNQANYGMGVMPMPQNQQQKRKAAPQKQLTRKQIKKIEKQKRREKDYFFIMRKGVCFVIFLLCLVMLLVSSAGLITSFVELPPEMSAIVDQFTAVYVEPDNTPVEERADGIDENGDTVPYEDKSNYISITDGLYGAINGLVGGEEGLSFTKDEEGNSLSPFYDEVYPSFEMVAETNPDDGMASIAGMIFQYAPLLIIIVIIASLIAMITSFFGMFGRRIFKGFGLAAILMIITAVAILVAGLAALGSITGPVMMEDGSMTSVLDFNNLMPFLTRSITGPPLVAIDLTVDVAPPALAAGFGGIILLGGSVLILILSLFARKKIPYSVFDR